MDLGEREGLEEAEGSETVAWLCSMRGKKSIFNEKCFKNVSRFFALPH